MKRCPFCSGEGIPIFYCMPAGPPDEVVSTTTGQDVWVYGKGKKRSLDGLLTGIRRYGRAPDWESPDRANDPLRKAKYLARRRPDYFSLVAIGCRFDFSVSYDGDRLSLVDDIIPIA